MSLFNLFEKRPINVTSDEEKYKQKLGQQGEKIAVRHLWKNGYRIIETNYKDEHGEIDIIAEEGEVLAFIEVKTRTSTDFGQPEQAVDDEKQSHISRAAQNYCALKKVKNRQCRFDVVSILVDPETTKQTIQLIKNAFST